VGLGLVGVILGGFLGWREVSVASQRVAYGEAEGSPPVVELLFLLGRFLV
jgi:hypothetical protein